MTKTQVKGVKMTNFDRFEDKPAVQALPEVYRRNMHVRILAYRRQTSASAFSPKEAIDIRG